MQLPEDSFERGPDPCSSPSFSLVLFGTGLTSVRRRLPLPKLLSSSVVPSCSDPPLAPSLAFAYTSRLYPPGTSKALRSICQILIHPLHHFLATSLQLPSSPILHVVPSVPVPVPVPDPLLFPPHSTVSISVCLAIRILLKDGEAVDFCAGWRSRRPPLARRGRGWGAVPFNRSRYGRRVGPI